MVGSMDAKALTDFDLFADAAPADIAAWAQRLTSVSFGTGEPMMREGGVSDAFYVVLSGEAIVTHRVGPAPETVGTLRSGSIIGELGLLRQRLRAATVLVTNPITALRGDADAFAELLAIAGVRPRLSKIVAGRLAGFAPITPVPLKSGHVIGMRAGLPSDRPYLADAIKRMSAESLHRRFFSAGVPDHLIDYLVDIDYVDHFSWVALESPSPEATPIGSCRYIRSFDDRRKAEVAFGIVDEWQGKGIGTVLIGALAIAASITGITTFTATVLYDNQPMRSIFNRAGAHWTHLEPGVLNTEVPAAGYRDVLSPGVQQRLATVSSDIIWGAGTMLF